MVQFGASSSVKLFRGDGVLTALRRRAPGTCQPKLTCRRLGKFISALWCNLVQFSLGDRQPERVQSAGQERHSKSARTPMRGWKQCPGLIHLKWVRSSRTGPLDLNGQKPSSTT